MKTQERKAREFQQREAEFLGLARRMMVEQGYAGLSMDRLAEATEYSKGTLYQHFSSKEDLVVALACQSMRTRADLFARAVSFAGRARERATAVAVADELFFRSHPHHFRSEQIIKLAALEDRASPDRTAELHRLERACFGPVLGVVEEAVAAGDLSPPPPLAAVDVCVGLWGLLAGSFDTAQNYGPLLAHYGVTTTLVGLRRQLQALFDGLHWEPLSTRWDYEDTCRRIERDVLPPAVVLAVGG